MLLVGDLLAVRAQQTIRCLGQLHRILFAQPCQRTQWLGQRRADAASAITGGFADAATGVVAEHAEALDWFVEDAADRTLQFAQRGTHAFQTIECHVQAQDLVGAFEDGKDAGVAGHLLIR
ncbi:hypothetical protein D9M72_637560 [compost metagenome]